MVMPSARPLRILIKGWTFIPHSYAMVNCYQIVHLMKYPVEIYVSEEPYFNPKWNAIVDTNFSIFPKRYRKILTSVTRYTGQKVDVIYSITYPYNIELGSPVKKCVFYTAEFSRLNSGYFKGSIDNICNHDLFFTSPSVWSSKGLASAVEARRNKVISHGVDPDIFYKTDKHRQAIRDLYGVSESTVLLLNMGSMTGNKGIRELLLALRHLLTTTTTKYKLMLKSISDLYSCKEMLREYTRQFEPDFLENVIIIDHTLSLAAMNHIFNACDIYVSPYKAEGFNLLPLEALSAGMRLVISKTGCTVDYTNTLYMSNHITYVNTNLAVADVGVFNEFTFIDVAFAIQNATRPTDSDYENLRRLLKEKFSWEVVSAQLIDYLQSFSTENVVS